MIPQPPIRDPQPLRVLIVEDSEDDARLVVRELQRGGYAPEWRRVETPEAMGAALREQEWDAILADYKLPHFSAPAALRLLQEAERDMPFIVISGTVGEDVAVEVMKAGAHDFFAKGALTRLVPAIQREIREAENRRRRRASEQALRESETRYRMLADNTLDVIWTMNMQLEFTYVNRAITEMTGHSTDEWIGSRLPDHCDEAHFAEMATLIQRELARGPETQGIVFETEMLRKDGSPIPLEIHAKIIVDENGAPAAIQGTTRDITERRRAEERERHIKAVLSSIRDVNQLIVRSKERKPLIEAAAESLVSTRGFRGAWIILPDRLTGDLLSAQTGFPDDAFREFTDRFKQDRVPNCCQRPVSEGGVVSISDPARECGDCPLAPCYNGGAGLGVGLVHGDRQFGNLGVSVPREYAEDDEEKSLLAEIAGDIAFALNGMEAENALQEAYDIVNRSSSVAFTWKNEERWPVVFVSDNVERLLGYTAQEIIRGDANYIACIHPQDLPRVVDEVAKQSSREEIREFVHQPYRLITKDGSEKIVKDWTFIVRDMDGRVVCYKGIVEDITEQQSIEDQMRQAQKMEAVGRLVGGVAHDYNNMLSVIMGYSQLAMDKVSAHDPLREDLEEIHTAAKRSRDITRQLLAFARKETIAPEVLDLNATVESMLKILRKLIGEDIDLVWRPGPGLRPVLMDPSQLGQILANLCVNARDAIADVGRITFQTSAATIDNAYCSKHTGFTPGDFVLLAVSDDGCGMERETMDSIFEPFFTTKGAGKGTGLGLSTVYGIVHQNEGFIDVYSEPGQGTTFKIYLPRHIGETERIPLPQEVEIPPGRGETVLLVEDEKAILKLGQRMLEGLGYRVLAADGTAEALALAESHEGEIHLLVTDVVMPEMNGRDLAERIKSFYPGLKVLFMSGYTADVIAHRGVLSTGVRFMQKPFPRQELAVRVREALEG